MSCTTTTTAIETEDLTHGPIIDVGRLPVSVYSSCDYILIEFTVKKEKLNNLDAEWRGE